MIRAAIVLLGLSSLTIWPQHARAWNEVGHAVISKLAYDELGKESPKLQLRLMQMLMKHPHYQQFLAKNRPPDANAAEWALMRASNWPDWVRPPFRAGDKPDPDRVRFHRAFDHFVNFPIVLDAGPQALAGNVPPVDPDRPDILNAFRQRMGELSEPAAAAEDKAVALCWIAHLIGDVHQPLHAATQFSKQFPEGDLGGNRFGVTVGGKPVRLHTYWDNALGEVPGWESDTPEHQAQVYALVARVAESVREPAYSRAALADALTKNSAFASWIDESHELAKTAVYRNNGKLLDAAFVKANVPGDAPDAGPGYEKRAQEVARLRAAQAGYRLADKLKVILSRQPVD